jgi:hypothetical protein
MPACQVYKLHCELLGSIHLRPSARVDPIECPRHLEFRVTEHPEIAYGLMVGNSDTWQLAINEAITSSVSSYTTTFGSIGGAESSVGGRSMEGSFQNIIDNGTRGLPKGDFLRLP